MTDVIGLKLSEAIELLGGNCRVVDVNPRDDGGEKYVAAVRKAKDGVVTLAVVEFKTEAE